MPHATHPATVFFRVILCLAFAALPAIAQKPADVFAVEGKPARQALLINATQADPSADAWDVPDAPMLRELVGIRAELSPRHLGRLRQAARSVRGETTSPVHVATLLLRSGETRATVTLSIAGDELIAEQPGTDLRASVALPRAEAVLGSLQPPAADAASQPAPGTIADLPGPYVASDLTLDRRTVRDRIQPPEHYRYPTGGPARRLDNEHMWIRLPADHDPEATAGLVVWVSPTPNWRIPPPFAVVLDGLGFIAVGVDNTGNQRAIIDRLQLQFDAIATVADRYRVDPDRVYVTGVSGGGRCSSILVGCFPDRFAGALPIVGLDSPHVLPLDDGKLIAGSFKRQRGDRLRLVRERRVFAITGSEDFNRAEMEERAHRQEADGVPIRLEIVPGMTHADLPAAELVAEGMRWIDEPQREALDVRERQARELLRAWIAEHGDEPPTEPGARDQLAEVCRLAPWGASAWRAAGLLGYGGR